MSADILQICVHRQGFWFRVFGYGLAVTTEPDPYSTRTNSRRVVRIGAIRLKTLTR